MEKVARDFNVLVIHAHWNNRGDEAAIRAMIDSLRLSLPMGKMRIMIFAANLEQFPYDDIEALRHFPERIHELIDAVMLFLLGGKSFTVQGRKFAEAVKEADIVIHAPGGPSIGEIYQEGLLEHSYLYRLLYSKVIGKKPVFFYAPSMGPFDNRCRNLLRRLLLKKMDMILLREEISARYLKNQLGIESIVTADSALQNAIPDDYLGKYAELSPFIDAIEKNKVVGMTITDLKWHPVYRNCPRISERIDRTLSKTMGILIERGYDLILIPQLFGDITDIPLLEKFRALSREHISILPGHIDSYAQQVLISRMHSIIGMRYHSNIFAAKGRTPFISITYEHKMRSFMDRLSLGELSVNVEDLDSDDLVRKFDYLVRNYQGIRRTLQKRMPELECESKRTSELIIMKTKQCVHRCDE